MNSTFLLSGLAFLIMAASDMHCIEQIHNIQFSQVRNEEERKQKEVGHLERREPRAFSTPERHDVLTHMQTPLRGPASTQRRAIPQLRVPEPRLTQTQPVPTVPVPAPTNTQGPGAPAPDIALPSAPAAPAAPINRGLQGPNKSARPNITIAQALAPLEQPRLDASVSLLPQALAPLPGEPLSITPRKLHRYRS